MKKSITKALMIIVEIAIKAAICVLEAIPIFYLWNWLLPDLFGFPEITFIQSIGISFLCGLLFKII